MKSCPLVCHIKGCHTLIRADITFQAPSTHNLVPFAIFLYLCCMPCSVILPFIEAGLT